MVTYFNDNIHTITDIADAISMIIMLQGIIPLQKQEWLIPTKRRNHAI
ncbi:MAG: hypothetical protein Q8K81_04845 [Sulfuricurvum sp.]|nr:hypothetical protein [Sulfuricurvum sp.]